MLFTPKEIVLKTGMSAVFRTPDTSDAVAMLSYIKQASSETDFLTRYPEEWDMTVEQEEKWLQSIADSVNNLMITCFIGNRVAGSCQLTFMEGFKMRHRATIGIAILRDYWNLGIGSAMLNELIAAARSRGIQIMELEFIEGNERGRRLYEKFGFRIIGERPNAFMLKDGTIRSEFLMQKYL